LGPGDGQRHPDVVGHRRADLRRGQSESRRGHADVVTTERRIHPRLHSHLRDSSGVNVMKLFSFVADDEPK
jgi:hypothetical protein